MKIQAKTMNKEFRWYVNNDEDFKKKVPEWMRSVAIDEAGKIFVPAVVWGNETKALLYASCDGNIEAFIDSNHLFLPIDWVEKEALQLETIEVCKRIRSRLQEAIKNETYH